MNGTMIVLFYFFLILCNFSWGKINPKSLWTHAIKKAFLEQNVEDQNSLQKINDNLTRKLIVMPLSEEFKLNQADLMFDKIQYGDKCSFPSSIGRLIYEKKYEVPWIFEIKPLKTKKQNSISHDLKSHQSFESNIEKTAYISPLDFRSPENYIYLPKWLLTFLEIEPYDLVEVSFIRLKLAGLVVLQPISKLWDEIMAEESQDPKSFLEHEINKYSSLTAGATIYIKSNSGKEIGFFLKETLDENGISVKGVRVQDSDIRTDIDRSLIDKKSK